MRTIYSKQRNKLVKCADVLVSRGNNLLIRSHDLHMSCAGLRNKATQTILFLHMYARSNIFSQI